MKGNKKKRVPKFLLPFVLFLALLVGAWVSSPKSSTIYFEGMADQAEFSLKADRQIAYDIKIDEFQNAEIAFGADKTETIFAVEKFASEELIQQALDGDLDSIDWESSQEIFPFKDGSATLFAQSPLHLALEVPESGSFPYDIEIVQDEEELDQEEERNRIVLKNFPKDLLIYLSASHDIAMNGTQKVMPAGIYRIIGCESISFYAISKSNTSQDFETGIEPSLKGEVEHFKFTNSGKDTFEITYFAETKFSEVGHVEVDGYVQKDRTLMLEVDDIGQYPIPVKIYGQAGTLTMAGSTCYPSWGQWLLDKRSELLFSIVTLYIGLIFENAKDEKNTAAAENKDCPCRHSCFRVPICSNTNANRSAAHENTSKCRPALRLKKVVCKRNRRK